MAILICRSQVQHHNKSQWPTSGTFTAKEKTKRQGGLQIGTPDAIRTHDLQSRSLTLYPTELQAHICNRLIITNPLSNVK